MNVITVIPFKIDAEILDVASLEECTKMVNDIQSFVKDKYGVKLRSITFYKKGSDFYLYNFIEAEKDSRVQTK